jgi:hypothetical protein
VNTNDLEGGPELLPDAPALRRWLLADDLIDPAASVTPGDHARAIAVREAIRELVCAHAGLPHDPRANEIVDEAARRARLRPVIDDLHTRYEPEATGVDAALGRLKACERDVCRWAFYDASKNRSGHWCSMAVCGSREKNRRAYRRRRAAAT